MAQDLNQCQFIGRVGRDPELITTNNGTEIVNFSIAVNGYKDGEVEWVRCTAFNKLAAVINQYVTKGKQLFVSGRMQTRQWEDKNGEKRYTTEIIVNNCQFLGGKSEAAQAQPAQAQKPPFQTESSPMDDSDIPF